jgi:hypothetical protein
VDRAAIVAYLERGWREAEMAKLDHWAREYAARGPGAGLAAAHALWLHARRLRPDWPTEAERLEDLEHHVALRRRLDRAARALDGR